MFADIHHFAQLKSQFQSLDELNFFVKYTDDFPVVETFSGSNNPGGIFTWTVKDSDVDGNSIGNPFMPAAEGEEPYDSGHPTTIGGSADS
mmetsp:Transcript_49100/g.76574  ORF Transcript_49100/g.76574 Transcript_49100/m.76574 type:complete len:90 (-) Transcript_49100:126-395(-)